MGKEGEATLGQAVFPVPKVTERDIAFFKTYRYKGQDNGLLNNYVLDYFYDFLVDKVLPSWLAPNTITIAGPVFAILALLLFALFHDHLTVPCFCIAAIGVFFFLVCDNCDGKHARKINCCSPLGDWLDHSLDIVSYVPIMYCVAVTLRFGPLMTWLLVAVPIITYMLVLWEALLTGELILNPIEGCSEGMFVCMSVQIAAALSPKARDIMSIPLIPGTQFNLTHVIAIVGLYVCGTSAVSIFHVLRSGDRLRHPEKYKDAKPAHKQLRPTPQQPQQSSLSYLATLIPIAFCLFANYKLLSTYPEASAGHLCALCMQLACGSVFWIDTCCICRLLGWHFAPKQMLRHPWSFVIALIPWLFIAIGLSPATAIVAGAWVSFAIVFAWWWAVSLKFADCLNTKLFSIVRINQDDAKKQ